MTTITAVPAIPPARGLRRMVIRPVLAKRCRAAGEGPRMRYRTIGWDLKTRREVSVLSLGVTRFGTATDEAGPAGPAAGAAPRSWPTAEPDAARRAAERVTFWCPACQPGEAR